MIYRKIPLDPTDESVFLEAFIAGKTKDFTRKAILVIPGGGYGDICAEREGEPIGIAFMAHGYNAFVLHYTVAQKKLFPAQLIEASLAMQHIKDHAEEYNIDPEQVFAVGFSAGGHLAASLGVMWNLPAIYDAIDLPYGYNKPAGVMLIYPVISGLDEKNRHLGSFINLRGTDTPTITQLEACSIEKHMHPDASPAYIVHTANDQLVPVKNSLVLAEAYAAAGLKFELHIYPDAPHGMALGNAITAEGVEKFDNPCLARWVENAVMWAERL